MLFRSLLFLVALTLSASAWAAHDHSAWDDLLQSNVVMTDDGASTKVNYGKFKEDRTKLQSYLTNLSTIDQSEFDSWSKDEQLAFLINAYNAWTVELILTKYPDLKSIKDLGSIVRSPWKRNFIPLFGDTVSLDHIEHDLIRGSGRYNDPRIHFAVNCASIGCPALHKSAYAGNRLASQLDAATKSFLQDRSRNRLKNGKLEISSIFKWYRRDFEDGWQGSRKLNEFLAIYGDALGLTKDQQTKLRAGKMKIRFLNYDWQLNKV